MSVKIARLLLNPKRETVVFIALMEQKNVLQNKFNIYYFVRFYNYSDNSYKDEPSMFYEKHKLA